MCTDICMHVRKRERKGCAPPRFGKRDESRAAVSGGWRTGTADVWHNSTHNGTS